MSVIRTALLLFSATALAGLPAPAPEVPADCGQENPDLPAFALEDLNPNSPTYGAVLESDAFLGKVTVVYWAQAT